MPESPAAAPALPTVYYFTDIRSRGEYPKLVASIRHVKIEEKFIDFKDWFGKNGKKAASPEGTLPYTVLPNSSIMADSWTSAEYFAVTEESDRPAIDCGRAQKELFDCCNNGIPFSINMFTNMVKDGEPFPVASTFKDDFFSFVNVMEDKYRHLDGRFMTCTDMPGLGEIALFHVLDLALVHYLNDLQQYKHLMAFYKKIASMPEVQSYCRSRVQVGNIGLVHSRGRVPGIEPSLDMVI